MRAGIAACLLLAGVALADDETSLERWSTVEIREATEAVEERWDQLLVTGAIDTAPPEAFAEARRAVDNALSGRRWDDDRERVYWIYQAERAMDFAELATEMVALGTEIHDLELRRAALDEVRIRREARLIAEEREAELRRREAELARREAEVALEREALAARQAAEARAASETTSRPDLPRVRALPLLQDLQEQAPTLVFEATRRGPMLLLEDMLFEIDGAAPESRARSQLETLQAYLAANPDVTVSVEGHWDAATPPARAEALATGRAEAVRDVLLDLGLAADRITARGFGGEQPITPGSTARDHETNRRVELFLAAPGG